MRLKQRCRTCNLFRISSPTHFRHSSETCRLCTTCVQQIFNCRVELLARDRFSILAKLCEEDCDLPVDENGHYFFDRDWCEIQIYSKPKYAYATVVVKQWTSRIGLMSFTNLQVDLQAHPEIPHGQSVASIHSSPTRTVGLQSKFVYHLIVAMSL